jgi:hypothetical protein
MGLVVLGFDPSSCRHQVGAVPPPNWLKKFVGLALGVEAALKDLAVRASS